MHVCFRGDLRSVDCLMNAGANLEGASQRDKSPLVLAAAMGRVRMCQKLLDAGAMIEDPWARKDIDVRTSATQMPLEKAYELGWTPLTVACQVGHEDVRLHLERNANTEPKSPMEKTALAIAKENGRTVILEMLESHLSASGVL